MTPDKKESATDQPQQSPASAEEVEKYPRRQLIEESRGLLGQPSYVVEVALRRYGGSADAFSIDKARGAVDKLLKHQVEG